MSGKIIILGAGAAPGVPSLSMGWGYCNPANKKNERHRTSTYVELKGVKILIDTSPDLREQLIQNNIKSLDGVLYTHSHADHVHGIDDLREINRLSRQSLNIYGGKKTLKTIKQRFDYLIAKPRQVKNVVRMPSLIPNTVKGNHEFFIKGLKITPIKLLQHCEECLGYIFNDGEYVHIADFKQIAESAFKMIKRRPKLVVMPLTTPYGQIQHAGLDEVLGYISRINPERVVLNHLASESDYEELSKATPNNIDIAYDGMEIEIK